ncbi:TIR domain-containing protein, partial [Shimia sp. R9_2]|uniref:leucine-rich repeat domain-containing protein n=1 Tax=Shimia sp. R9_2 TaxID=2821112 RepID=UPI001ADCBA05
SGLSQLQSLDCWSTQVNDLAPLSGLSQLQSLDCSHTQVSDLAPLSGLSQLQRLTCSGTEVSDLAPLSGLSQLQSLDCWSTQVNDLAPLSGLSQLQRLDCSHTQVSDLAPLSGLSQLQRLTCSHTQVSDLAPLSGLSQLQSLTCSGTEVSDLAPLSGLSRLQSLDCSGTEVSDLAPLSGLSRLQSLDCSGLDLKVSQPLHDLLLVESFQVLNAYRTRAQGLPNEVFSTASFENCAGRVRAHFADLGNDPTLLETVKLIILGNGRIGKTQISNRLRDLPFEQNADSTHGIKLSETPIPGRRGTFRIWDFGGQEIYHGTHALFLRSRAVFLLVWTPDTDNGDEDISVHGLQFRNRPVGWWLDFVQRFGEPDTPLIMVQNQIDRDGQYARGDHPDLAPFRNERRYCRAVAVSARTPEGLPSLQDALNGAADRFNPPLIGAGRLTVLRQLREMLAEDLKHEPRDRRHRTLSMEDFCKLCKATDGISNVEQFLAFLHNAGEVFWLRTGETDTIVLDQAWALEAIYAVYERQKCWTNLLYSRGRFSRQIMGSFLWDRQGYSAEEQRLFVSFMCQSGICFQVSGSLREDTALYIAPDALPEHLDGEHPAPIDDADATHCYWFESKAPGFMRALLVEIGRQAGIHGIYWRHGFSGYALEQQTRIQVEEVNDPDHGHGLQLRAKGRNAGELIGTLGKLSERVMELFKLTSKAAAPQQPEGDPRVTFTPDPNMPKNFFVSYAWSDKDAPDRATIVDEFCTRAEREGIKIKRDKNEIQFGESISEFMGRLVEGDRILIVLTDKYLRSVACMTELYQIWHRAGHDPEEFMAKVRLFTADDAKIFSAVGRGLIGKHWHDEYEAQKSVLEFMGDKDRVAHNRLKRFYAHVPDILELISDTLQPRSLDDLVEYALD